MSLQRCVYGACLRIDTDMRRRICLKRRQGDTYQLMHSLDNIIDMIFI